ncbi:CU044_5270 family protein [Streptomyces sp. NPDC001970]
MAARHRHERHAQHAARRHAADGVGASRIEPGRRAGRGSYRHLETLTDPGTMLDRLRENADGGGSNSEEQQMFALVGDLIRENALPPEVGAALCRAAAKIPGAVVVDDVADAAGRHGVAIAREDDGIRAQLIFDRNAKELLGERDIAVRDTEDGPEKGELAGTSAILERAVVDRVGETR